mgnify:CR=1 FL=1
MTAFPPDLLQRLAAAKVVAGFSVERLADAVPIAQATRAIHAGVPDMLLGVGTILTPEQARDVKEAGADFGVSPGLNVKVLEAAASAGLPFAPGVATPSELETAIDAGCRLVKFFPAEACGGVNYLKSMGAPYAHLGIHYFPLGGLNAANMVDYLSLPNVPAIGGSWIVQNDLVKRADWVGIRARAAAVMQAVANL